MNELDFTTLRLSSGSHSNPDDGMCLLEAVSYVAGEAFTDRPKCVSKVLGTFGRALNDALGYSRRQELIPFISKLIGTAGDGFDETRTYMALDWFIRTYTPTWLDLAGLSIEATALRSLPRIVDADTEHAVNMNLVANSTLEATKTAIQNADQNGPWPTARDTPWRVTRSVSVCALTDAAGDAAVNVGWDAVGQDSPSVVWALQVAAWNAAQIASWNTARDAAQAAAQAAAARNATVDDVLDAAIDAAKTATEKALKPTVKKLQTSAIELFDAMI